MTQFTDLGLDAALLKALDGEGYTTPTPIQAEAIPHVLAGRDLLGIAQTGTGKTAAFALPILHRLAANRRAPMRKGCRALVLSPTRELASQIGESFKTYGRHIGVTVAVVFGGVGHKPQRDALARGVDVLVATPGRLLDHMSARDCDISGTEIFVLDEADQMLDLGFVVPIRRIVKHLSQRRQSLFFSATMPAEIGKLAAELLTDPIRVAVTPVATTAERVSQRVIHVTREQKVAVLAELFADAAIERALVFTRTKRGADRVARKLEATGVPVAAIHGNKSQRQRENALADFKASRIRALVATDIAARGIDVEGVSHVINFELPNVPESYVHRIGRTARAGAEGIAISLCEGEENDYLRDIERLIRQKIPALDRRADTSIRVEPARANGHPHQAHRDERRGERRGGQPRQGEQGRLGTSADHRQPGRAHADGSESDARSKPRAHVKQGKLNRGPRIDQDHRRQGGERRDDHHHQPRHSRDFVNELAFGVIPRPPGYREPGPSEERPRHQGAPSRHERSHHGRPHQGHSHNGRPHQAQDDGRRERRRDDLGQSGRQHEARGGHADRGQGDPRRNRGEHRRRFGGRHERVGRARLGAFD